jgi:hypothetical protein
MKKVLLIGLILAICILAFPQGVMAASDNAEVIATIESVSEVHASFVGGWVLERGADNSFDNAILVTVDSTSPWGLTASDEKSVEDHKGYMVGSDGSPLATAFEFNGAGLAAPQTLFPAGQAGQEENTESPYPYGIDQDVTEDDNSALAPYTITVTFTLTSA